MKTTQTFALLIGLCAVTLIQAQSVHSTWQIIPEDGAIADQFGWDVEIDGEWLFASAPWDDQSIDGEASLGFNSGSIYIYWWNGNEWIWHSKIISQIPQQGALFGHSIAIWDDILYIGAPGDIGNGETPGAIYQFEWNGNAWIEINKIIPEIGSGIQDFGWLIEISEGWMTAIGNSGDEMAGIITWKEIDGIWIQIDTIISENAAFDSYARSAGLWNDKLITGHPIVDIPQPDGGIISTFGWNDENWISTGIIAGSEINAGDGFGHSISIWEDKMIIGAPCSSGANAGSAYIYSNDGISWIEEEIIWAPNSIDGDAFGSGVAIWNDIICITSETNKNIHIWQNHNDIWWEIDSHQPLGTSPDDQFGHSIDIDREWIVIGACGHDQLNNWDMGAIYISRLQGCTDQIACNYSDIWAIDNGCEYEACEDPAALNYDAEAWCWGNECHYFGDFNNSGEADIADLLILLTEFGCNSNCTHDLTNDNLINTADLMAWLAGS